MQTLVNGLQSEYLYSLDRELANFEKNISEVRCFCGGNHLPQDHARFAEGMPQDPVDLVDDLLNLGGESHQSRDDRGSIFGLRRWE